MGTVIIVKIVFFESIIPQIIRLNAVLWLRKGEKMIDYVKTFVNSAFLR